ncbi:MAG TPA: YhjD/YihY/BrkB family envelope integrity protein [Solirubrobacteraceae bacterium]|jgi:YihY family inner membrane protein
MDFLRPVRAFDRFQQRHKAVAVPVAVIKKFGDDQAGSLAALVAYYAFFSLFPLLLVLVTILAYALQGNPSLQHSISTSVLSQFPIIGTDISKNIHSLHGHVISLVIGIVTSLLAGLGVTQAAQNAFARVWAVPFKDRPDFLRSRLRGLGLLLALGLMFILATLASGLVTGGLGGPIAKVGGIAISLLLNFALFFAAFRFLTPGTIAPSRLWIGVVVAGVFWEILQVVGGIYIGHVFKHSKNTYGLFGIVIALLVWLHLGAQMTLYAAEVNVVVERKLWPRSLLGPPRVAADEETLTALAKVEERHDTEQVDVHFDN